MPEIDPGIAPAPAKGLWHKYRQYVQAATLGSKNKESIIYWREKLFTSFITYLLPSCIIALVPGVYMSWINGYVFVAVADIAVVAGIATVSLNRRLSLNFRKVFVAIILYSLSIMLIISLSFFGPGMFYLFALSVVVTVTCPKNWGYWTIIINLATCIICALVIHFKLFNSLLATTYNLGAWIAVSSNVLFLSFIMVVLISNAIEGLEQVIIKELLLKMSWLQRVLKK